MDNISPPRNQQARQEVNFDRTSSATDRELDVSSQNFRSSTSIPERTNQETDLHFSSSQVSPVQVIERDSTCRNCYSTGLSINQYSSPLKTDLTLGSLYSDGFQQTRHSVNAGTYRHFDPSRIQKSTECFGDESQGSAKMQYDRTQIKAENTPSVKLKKEKKEKKTISSKTFAHGLMDMSLMTSNASQLRSVLSNPDHEFYNLLMYLLIASVVLQILSGIVLIVADFHKSQIKEKDRQNQKKRKTMNFVALAIMMVITSLNVLITAFNTPSNVVYRTVEAGPPPQPVFSPANYQLHTNHTEL